jgi:hypothetical protein
MFDIIVSPECAFIEAVSQVQVNDLEGEIAGSRSGAHRRRGCAERQPRCHT